MKQVLVAAVVIAKVADVLEMVDQELSLFAIQLPYHLYCSVHQRFQVQSAQEKH
jgi:hypothetical protein